MQLIDPDVLVPLVSRFVDRSGLTPAERSEVLRLAQGFACKDSAAAAEISPETIRARRKRIYRKLRVRGSGEVVAALLGMTLGMLASGERLDGSATAESSPSGPRLVSAGEGA